MPLSDSRVICVGASHSTVPLDILERFAIPEGEIRLLLGTLASTARESGRRAELVMLSTCNRTEIYAVAEAPPAVAAAAPGGESILAGLPDVLIGFLEHCSGLRRGELAPLLYRHEAGAAEAHLLRVIAGLDSLVVGETQIIGQVARAYSAAQLAGTAGPALSLLFEWAIRASRKTRARSAGGPRVSSASSIAVQRAEDLAGALSRARVLLIGTGETGRLVLRALRERRAGRIDVVTRSEDRAAALSERWGIEVVTPARLPDLLEASDLVISTTSSSVPLVTEAMVRAALRQRGERPLALIDVAVPRTIEKQAGLVPGVTLLDIDSFKDPARQSAAEEDPVTTTNIQEELGVLELRMAEMTLRPVIGGVWRRADGIRHEVLTRTRARVPELDDRAWVHIENLAHALVAKLLHDPATRLRAEAGNGHAREHAEALRHLFALPALPALPEFPGRPPQ